MTAYFPGLLQVAKSGRAKPVLWTQTYPYTGMMQSYANVVNKMSKLTYNWMRSIIVQNAD